MALTVSYLLFIPFLPVDFYYHMLIDFFFVWNILPATFFAYGQTSSGKTYTMGGITEYAIQDIYDYIDTVNEIYFVLLKSIRILHS